MRNRALRWCVLALSFLPFTSDAQEHALDPEQTIQVRIKAKGKRKRGVVQYIPSLRVDVGIDPVGAVGLTVLATATTDEDGGAVVDLPYSLLKRRSDSEDLRVWASLKSPGYQQRTAAVAVEIDLDTKELPTLLVPIEKGSTIRGVLLDRVGQPISGSVLGHRLESKGAWRRAESTEAHPRTGFRLHLKDEGSWCLTAEATKPFRRDSLGVGSGASPYLRPWDESFAGAAKSEVFEYRRGDPSRDIVLRLVGPGRVRGRVVDAFGVPAAGLGLEILIARAGDSFGAADEWGMLNITEYSKQSSRYRLEGKGHYQRNVTTDTDGRFDCEGLRDEPYVIRTRSALGQRWTCDNPLDPRHRELRFTEDRRKHLVVFVRDPGGNLSRDLELVSGGNLFGFANSWPKAPALMVVSDPEATRGSQVSDVILRGTQIESGVVAFELPHIGEYHAVLMTPGADLILRRVQASAGIGRVDMVIDLGPTAAQGELVVSVVDPNGAIVDDLVSVRVVECEAGIPILERRNFYSHAGTEPWPVKFALPVGDYRLEVNSISSVEYQHGLLAKSREHGGYEQMVHVRSGKETIVEAQLEKPSFLLLSLNGEVNEADLLAEKFRYLWPNETIEFHAKRAEIILRRENGYPIQVEFAEYSGQGTSAAGTHLTSRLGLGLPAKSGALPSGNYRLEAKLPGGRIATKDVFLVPGETTSVDLSFPPGN